MNKLGISVENASASSRSVTFGSQIEKFDGSRPEKLREWLRSVEKFASLSGTQPLDMAYMASKDHRREENVYRLYIVLLVLWKML